MSVGVLGEYVGRLYEQVKQRPIYMVAETYNLSASVQHNTAAGAREN
jgi:dolichol-phosphate mannosyltransferase